MRYILLIIAALAVAGCTRYEYVIIDPPDLATTIGSKSDAVFTTASAEYRLRTVENVLVMRIYNPGKTTMQLLGGKSVVVGTDGASHPIIGQTIAAGSFIKLILPPPRPQLEPDGPGFHYGVGVSSGGYYRNSWAVRGDRGKRYHAGPVRPRYSGPYDGPDFYDPPSYTVYDASNPAYWDWKGETQVSLILGFDVDGKRADDRFVIQRRKAD